MENADVLKNHLSGMSNACFAPVKLDEKFKIDDCRVSIGCGAFIPHTHHAIEHIPLCYQCINQHCTLGLNNYLLFKDYVPED